MMNYSYSNQQDVELSNIRIAICDDEERILFLLKKRIAAFVEQCGLSANISVFTDIDMLLDKNEFDIYFLDIEIGSQRGDEYVKILRKKSSGSNFVFVSWHDNYIRKVMYEKPFAFIRKTNLDEDLDECLAEIHERLLINRSYTYLLDGNLTMMITLNKVKYFQSNNHDVEIHWNDGNVTAIRNILDIIEANVNSVFMRCHKSFLVNVDYITNIKANKIYLGNQEEIPISRKYKNKVDSYIMNYFLEGM